MPECTQYTFPFNIALSGISVFGMITRTNNNIEGYQRFSEGICFAKSLGLPSTGESTV